MTVFIAEKIVTPTEDMFMDQDSIRKAILTIKPMKSEGFDKILQRIFLDEVS
jgi:hypothetical protein